MVLLVVIRLLDRAEVHLESILFFLEEDSLLSMDILNASVYQDLGRLCLDVDQVHFLKS